MTIISRSVYLNHTRLNNSWVHFRTRREHVTTSLQWPARLSESCLHLSVQLVLNHSILTPVDAALATLAFLLFLRHPSTLILGVYVSQCSLWYPLGDSFSPQSLCSDINVLWDLSQPHYSILQSCFCPTLPLLPALLFLISIALPPFNHVYCLGFVVVVLKLLVVRVKDPQEQ